MRIKSDALKTVLLDYVEDLFAQFTQGWENMMNKVIVKMLISNRFKDLAPLFDQEGYMNVEDLEAFLLPEVKKLGIIEVNGINKRYSFKEDDFLRLFAQIKARSTNDA